MIRFIILAVVGFLAYRAIKSWMFPTGPTSESIGGGHVSKIDDVMIKDPYCEAYFPQKDAVHLRFDGRDPQFCSTRCKQKFLDAHSPKKNP